jgi:hypothetical protein
MIYLTPKIWEPDLSPPLVAPDAMTIPKDEGPLSPFEKQKDN